MKELDEKYKEDFSNKLNDKIEQEDWGGAKILLEEEIKKYPDEYFLLTSLAKVFYNMNCFNESLEYSQKAMKIEPNDVLVIYDYGCSLTALEMNEEAIKQWDKIIETNTNEIAYGEFGEGLRWAKSIQNDARYRKALNLLELHKKEDAVFFIKEHLKYRQRGIYSDFTKQEVVNKLGMLNK